MKKLLIICILLFISTSLYAAYSSDFTEIARETSGNDTLSEMRTELRRKVNDQTNSFNTNRYSDTELNYYINSAQRDICIYTGCLFSKATAELLLGTTEYYLPENILAINRIEYGDILIIETDVKDLDRDMNAWFTVSASSPTYYYPRKGLQTIGFYTPPEYNDSIATMWYIKIPDDMTSDSDEIFNSDPKLNAFKDTITLGALTHLLFISNDNRWSLVEQKYAQRISDLRSYYNMRPNYKPGLRIGRN